MARYRNRYEMPHTTHYEVVVDNGDTERRHQYAADECEMASSCYYRAKASGAFSAQIITYKSDGTHFRSASFGL